jgi:hypothetical protein
MWFVSKFLPFLTASQLMTVCTQLMTDSGYTEIREIWYARFGYVIAQNFYAL